MAPATKPQPQIELEPISTTQDETELAEEFESLLSSFSIALLEKLIANERKYKFGYAWKERDWQEDLQRDLLKHVEKGDPKDVAIYALFAWYHGWRTAPEVKQA